MSPRYRTKLVLKLFPSIPRAVFGGTKLTELLERHLFYREFTFSPWKLAFLAVALAALATWSVASLGLAWHAVHRTEGLQASLAAREAAVAEERQALNAARRDYYLLLSRLEPLNDKVDELADFSQRLAIVAGVGGLGEQLGSTAEQRRLELRLTEGEVAALDARFDRLGSFVAQQESELARTPSISPLKDTFVPTDRFGYRVSRFLRQQRARGSGGTGDRQFHAGLDLAAPIGTPIHATADGTVHFAARIPARQNPSAAYYGNFVVLEHGNGVRTVYAHCDRLNVQAGDEVQRGEVIAWVGNTGRSTGPHLHYEVVVNGRPVDPELFVLDVDIPDRRVRVDFQDHSLLVDEVDRLLGH